MHRQRQLRERLGRSLVRLARFHSAFRLFEAETQRAGFLPVAQGAQKPANLVRPLLLKPTINALLKRPVSGLMRRASTACCCAR